jgi:hypothetical protein
MVLAFTIDEYLEYIKNASNLNKRMMSMLIERFKVRCNCLKTSLIVLYKKKGIQHVSLFF